MRIVRRVAVASVVALAVASGGWGAWGQDGAPAAGPEPLEPSVEAPAADDQPGGEVAEPAPDKAAPEADAAQSAAVQAAATDDPVEEQLSLPALAEAPPAASFTGSYGTSVQIEMPPFRGLEPGLGLVYDSGGGAGASDGDAGFVGIGWRLSGLPEVVRTSRIGGLPRFDGTDVSVLGGEELLPCAGTQPNASCSAGGTHTTRSESGRKIVRDVTANTWTVYAPDGTKSVYRPVSIWGDAEDPAPAELKTGYRWLLASVTDTHNNTVAYSYGCDALPSCWPSRISYNGVQIDLVRYTAASAPVMQRATGKGLVELRGLLKRIEVRVNGAKQRVYALGYDVPVSGLRRLISVQTFGRDWTVAADGTVDGTHLPAWSFDYADAGTAVEVKQFDWLNTNTATSYADFTGDARQDVLQVYSWARVSGGNTVYVCNAKIHTAAQGQNRR